LEAIIRQAVTSPCNSNNHTNIINTVHNQVDVVAFSLGARIALATMAKYPTLIRKAHLTGIAAQRETMGNMIFESWKDMLSPDQGSSNLRPFAWSLIMSTYSKTFLEENGLDKVLGWVDHICNNHHRMGLYHLLEQNRHFDPINDAQDVERSSRTEIQIAVGSQDVISTPEQAKRLNDALGSKNNIQIYEGCGHAVLNEHPRQWRNDVLTFLNK
jgi:pimeloyl-ACP methyl ester carboxylesterase